VKHQCPDEETLAAYFDGLLPPADEAALHAEMLRCPDCLELVGALGLVLRAEAPDAFARAPAVPEAVTRRALDLWPAEPDSSLDRALRIAVRWLGERLQPLTDALQPAAAPALAMRGAAQPAERDDLRYQITLGDLPLEIGLESDGPQRLALTVRPLRAPAAGTLLRLTTAGETRALSSLTADGATVPALAPGQYRLTVEHRNHPLGHLQLSLAG
jgi:hypothetical protein